MPSFTGQLPNLLADGPIVEVLVRAPQPLLQVLKARNQPLPQPTRVFAMIDTGASGTVIAPPVVAALGIHPVSLAQMSTPSTPAPVSVNQYNVDIMFPNGVTVNNVIAMEAPLGGQHIQCLIGRDVLQHGVLIYIGYLKQFTVSF